MLSSRSLLCVVVMSYHPVTKRDSSAAMELSQLGGPLDGEFSLNRGVFGAHLAPKLGETEDESSLRENAITALVRAAKGTSRSPVRLWHGCEPSRHIRSVVNREKYMCVMG